MCVDTAKNDILDRLFARSDIAAARMAELAGKGASHDFSAAAKEFADVVSAIDVVMALENIES